MANGLNCSHAAAGRILSVLMLVYAVLSGAAHAQHFFNKRETLYCFASILTGVVQENGKFYTCGITIDSSNHVGGGTFNVVPGVEFAVFDSSGALLHDTVFQLPRAVVGVDSARYLGAWFPPLRRTPSGDGFITTSESTNSWDIMHSAIFIFDTAGVPLMRREYDQPTSLCALPDSNLRYLFTRDLKPDGQGGWLMLSIVGCAASFLGVEHNTMLVRLDSSFNVVWHRLYGGADGLHNYAKRLLVEDDGYLLLCTDQQVVPPYYQAPSYHVQMYKVDTAGNLLWEYNSSSADTIWKEATDIMRTTDGGYLWCGNDGIKDIANPAYPQHRYRPRVEKLDSNRNTEWAIYTRGIRGGPAPNMHFASLSDGDVAVAGVAGMYHEDEKDSSRGGHYATLARLDPITGAIRWQRRYRAPGDTDAVNGMDVQIYDLQATADGGFVMVGMANDMAWPQELPNCRSWIIKVDANGCLGPDDPQCKEAPAGGFFTLVKSATAFSLHPNPTATGAFTLAAPAPALVAVHDAAGRAVLSQTVAAGTTVLQLPPSAPPGVYAVRILPTGGSPSQTLRLVLRR